MPKDDGARGKVSPARWAAFEALAQVEGTSAHSDDLLHGKLLHGLSQADKNLTMALVLGVLRWQIALDSEVQEFLERPEQPLAAPVRIALRLGMFQLHHMDRIPPHAVLNESVEVVRAAGHPKAAGLVNAVLRKVAASPGRRRPIVESSATLATRLGHPAWLVERWVKHYGRAAAKAICEYDQSEPAHGTLFETAAGDARLDDGSRLVAELAAACHPQAKRVWDACAAPGGKTEVLATRCSEAEMVATEISPRRLQAMRQRFERELPGRVVRTLEADATKLPESEGMFDLILCDVPCSGTGTLARNPEIRHRLRPEDLARQALRQREILSAALERLKRGGRLVYSTCSLEPEENEEVVREVMESQSGKVGVVPAGEVVKRLRVMGVVRHGEGLGEVVRGEFLRTLPRANFAGDGFFAAVFMKSE